MRITGLLELVVLIKIHNAHIRFLASWVGWWLKVAFIIACDVIISLRWICWAKLLVFCLVSSNILSLSWHCINSLDICKCTSLRLRPLFVGNLWHLLITCIRHFNSSFLICLTLQSITHIRLLDHSNVLSDTHVFLNNIASLFVITHNHLWVFVDWSRGVLRRILAVYMTHGKLCFEPWIIAKIELVSRLVTTLRIETTFMRCRQLVSHEKFYPIWWIRAFKILLQLSYLFRSHHELKSHQFSFFKCEIIWFSQWIVGLFLVLSLHVLKLWRTLNVEDTQILRPLISS